MPTPVCEEDGCQVTGEHHVIVDQPANLRLCTYHAAIWLLGDMSGDDARRALADAGHGATPPIGTQEKP